MTVNEKLRRNFKQRIELERQVLSLVNTHIKECHLVGLSEVSIIEWGKRVLAAHESVVAILLKISFRLRLDYNVSNEMYSEMNGTPVPKLKKLLNVLESVLRSPHLPSNPTLK